MNQEQEKVCICGDSEQMHIDCVERCFHGDCRCKEFEESEESEFRRTEGDFMEPFPDCDKS